jgi:hypothetical protein
LVAAISVGTALTARQQRRLISRLLQEFIAASNALTSIPAFDLTRTAQDISERYSALQDPR